MPPEPTIKRAVAFVDGQNRSLRYRNKTVKLPNGAMHAFLTAEEKGIDVRIAIDVIRLAHRNAYDVALIFSQDQTSPSCVQRFV